MNRKRKISPLKIPSGEYTREVLNQFVRSHNELVDNVSNPGDEVATSLQFIDCAESGYGLPIGGVYVDANGFLKLVRASDTFAPSFSIRVRLGTATTTT